MEEQDLWDIADGLAAWFASCPGSEGARLPLLVLKLTEEVGEVADALVNFRGANPRKPVTKTEEDVAEELGDCVITAAMVLASMKPDARAFFQEHLTRSWTRAREAGAKPLLNQEGTRAEDDDDTIIFQPGQQILELREAYSASRSAFAKLIHQAGIMIHEPNTCSTDTIKSWEQGRVRSISLRFQLALRYVHNNRPSEADELTTSNDPESK